MSALYTSSRPPHCVSPRPHTDASQRMQTYGKLLPLPTPRPSLLRIAIEGDGSAVSFGTGLAFVAAVLFVVGGLLAGSQVLL